MKIFLVGKGIWSAKINKILESTSIQTEIVSARFFLKNAEALKRKIIDEKFDFIWITTLPETQYKVLREIEMIKKKIILEKPIIFKKNISDTEILNYFEEYESLNFLFLSKLWNYSALWLHTLKVLSGSKIIRIEITRYGRKKHKEITPYLDWLSHDLALLLDLSEEEIVLDDWKLRKKGAQGKFNLHFGNCKIEMLGGYSKIVKKSTWKFKLHDIDLVVNFSKGTIKIVNKKNNVSTIEKIDNNPIINMLEDYQKNNSHISQIELIKLCRLQSSMEDIRFENV